MGKKSKMVSNQKAARSIRKNGNGLAENVGLPSPPTGQLWSELRFQVGTTVLCRRGNDRWKPGEIVRLWYREPHWPGQSYAPYQIELQSGRLIFAPRDADEYVRARYPEEHMTLSDQALKAVQNNSFREASDLYLEAVRAAPAKWTARRFYNFCSGYCGSLKEGAEVGSNNFCINNRDIKALKSFIYSKGEPILFRVCAANMCAKVHYMTPYNRLDFHAAADFFRFGISLVDQANPDEKRRIVHFTSNHDIRTVEEILGSYRQSMAKQLDDWSTEAQRIKTLAEGIKSDHCHRAGLLKRMIPGGHECDCCGKSLEDTGAACFDVCQRCKESYYCSVECQRKQWKAGHKKACRKPGQIDRGDVMLLLRESVVASEDIENVTLVKIIGPERTSKSRFVVQTINGLSYEGSVNANSVISVTKNKLFHIRPSM